MNDNEFRQNYDIDHFRPLATFNLSDPDAQYDAFFWQNWQPLLKSKNLREGAKLNLWSQVMMELKVTVFLKLYYPESFDN